MIEISAGLSLSCESDSCHLKAALIQFLYSYIDTDTWASITQTLINRALEPVKNVIREAKVTFDRSEIPFMCPSLAPGWLIYFFCSQHRRNRGGGFSNQVSTGCGCLA
jgi:hypothetical protein